MSHSNILRRTFYSLLFTGVTSSLFIIWSCKKKSDDDCPVCPVVESIAPMSGHKGDVITITGSKFLSTGNTVLFNGDSAEIIEESENRIRAKVPLKCGTGPVTVKIDEDLVASNRPIFNYKLKAERTLYAGIPNVSGYTNSGELFLNAKFNGPSKLAVDKLLNVYFIDELNDKVRKLDMATGVDSTIAVTVANPCAIAVDKYNNLYVSGYDFTSTKSTIFKFTSGDATANVYWADPTFNVRHIYLSFDDADDLYICRSVDPGQTNNPTDIIHYVSGVPLEVIMTNSGYTIFYKSPYLYQVSKINCTGTGDSRLSHMVPPDINETDLVTCNEGLKYAEGLVVTNNNDVYVADLDNGKIKVYTESTGLFEDVFSDLNSPKGIAIDINGNIYFSEYGNHCIWKITFE